MGKNVLSRAGLVLLCIASLSSQAFSQPQASAAPQPTAKDHLTLDVVVTDRAGKTIKGLEEKDFTVFDNKRPQNILSFQAEVPGTATGSLQPAEPPFKIILLVDEVNTNFSRVAYERQEIRKFLLQKEGVLAHPMSLAFFSDTDAEIQNNSSRDGNALLAAFDQHETALRTIRRGEGFYGAVERFQLSLKTLDSIIAKEAQTPGRKVVIWISPGWPILSGPGVELSNKQRDQILSSIVSVSTALRQARITLYNIDPQGAEAAGGIQSYYYREFLKPVTTSKSVLPGNLALQVISEQSGGLVFPASNDITGQINRCVADVDAFYTLTLDAAIADRPNEFHAIEVKVATPGLTARTRNGYYAQP
jgi:VWFA-related protein